MASTASVTRAEARSKERRQVQDRQLHELLPPDTVDPPSYGYVEELVRERQRLFGSAAASLVNAAWPGTAPSQTASLTTGQQARRSKTQRAREVTIRRMGLRDPIIPDAYKKTAMTSRVGQSLFYDISTRIPALLSARPWQFKAWPLGDDEDSLDAATLKEEFVQAFLTGREGQRAVLDQGLTSVWRDFIDCLFNLGEGAFQLVARRDRWAPGNGYPIRDDFEDDEDDVLPSKRQTGAEKYLKAAKAFRATVPPFVMEHLHPQLVHVIEGEDGIPDEGIIVARRPYRATMVSHGLLPTRDKYNVLEGNEGRRYTVGPEGLGRPYPIMDFPTGGLYPETVETVTYYGSARRAAYLGLRLEGSEPDLGVWAHYVDGVLVDYGGLWGPPWHPLPLFVTPGISTAIPDANFRGVPGVFPLIELADLLDQVFTMHAQVAMWSSFPMIWEEDKGGGTGATGITGDVLEDPEQLQGTLRGGSKEVRTIQPGNFYVVPPGKTWRFAVPPAEATKHLDTLYDRIRELFDLLGVPAVFRGVGSSGQPGYAIAQLLVAARSVYDPLMDNAGHTINMAVKYLLWQIWRRFPEGIDVYRSWTSDRASAAKADRGWIHLGPRDIAPDCPQGKAGKGTPFLEGSVKGEVLLPVDEAQQEVRAVNAVKAQMMDRYTARERYYNDPAPEKTEARIIAQGAADHPIALANVTYRMLVHSGDLLPQVATAMYAKEFGLSAGDALSQLASVGVFTPQQVQEVAAMIAEQQQRQIAGQMAQGAPMAMPGTGMPPGPPGVGGMLPPGVALSGQLPAPMGGGMPPGAQPVPGMPGLPAAAPQVPIAPQPPQAPPIQGGNTRLPPPAAGGRPTRQPSVAARQAATVR